MICIEINHTGARKPWWVDSTPPRLLDRQNIPALLGLTPVDLCNFVKNGFNPICEVQENGKRIPLTKNSRCET